MIHQLDIFGFTSEMLIKKKAFERVRLRVSVELQVCLHVHLQKSGSC